MMKTLAGIIGPWTDRIPDEEDSQVVRRSYQLMSLPIDEFQVEDVRLCVSQRLGLIAVIPKAIEMLGNDLLCEGDYYPGDLLAAVLKLDERDWKGSEAELEKFIVLLGDVEAQVSASDFLADFMKAELIEEVRDWKMRQ